VAELKFRHTSEVPAIEVKAQDHDGRRVSVWIRPLERSRVTVISTFYDPGVILERHGHSSDHVIFVTGGHLRVGERDCPAGTAVILEHGATFGPLVAGPEGAELIEFYSGDATPVPEDEAAFEAFLTEQGVTALTPTFQPGMATGAR
jgi:quercetin dioxygenase-like cupin family protein